MAIVDALNKVTGGHGSTIEEAVKNLSSGGGSGNDYVVNISEFWTEQSETPTLTADKTFDELVSAYNDGKNLVAVITSYIDGVPDVPHKSLYSDSTFLDDSISAFLFSVLYSDFSTFVITSYSISNSEILTNTLVFEAH